MKSFIRLSLNINSRKVLPFYLLLVMGMVACELNVSDEEEVLASVENFKLYQSDFDRFALVYDISLTDSLAKESFIKNWINKMIINLEAKERLPAEYNQNKEKSLDLLYELNLFALENKHLHSKLDTVITQEEIQNHYQQQYPADEKPKQLIRALYIKMPDTLKQADTMKVAYLLKNNKDTALVNRIGKHFGTVFYFEKNKWMSLDQLLRELPLSQDKKNKLFIDKGNSVFELDGYLYFLNIFETTEYVKERVISPQEEEVIRNHLLKLRINDLRKKTEQEILNNASEKYSINNH